MGFCMTGSYSYGLSSKCFDLFWTVTMILHIPRGYNTRFAIFYVTVHSYLVPVTDFADASHSKSAKSTATTVSYGIFSSENAYL